MAEKKKQSFKLPGYKLAKVLGRGAQGIVIKGMREADRQYVAIKVLKVANLNDDFYERRFSREARLLLAMEHPNLVGALDIGRLTEGPYQGPYLVLEYVEGETMVDRLRKGVLDEQAALVYMRQTAEGMDYYASEHNLVHRDLKPENLMITVDDVVKIMDLGLAKMTTDESGLTVTGDIFGTPGFMSPEAAEDTKSADIRSDIYSLGCTFYRMLTKQMPYDERNFAKLLSLMASTEPTQPNQLRPELSDTVNALVMKMMARDNELRQQDPEQLLEDIDRVLEGRMPRTARPPRPEKKRGLFRRGK